jgi:hypothetical protein
VQRYKLITGAIAKYAVFAFELGALSLFAFLFGTHADDIDVACTRTDIAWWIVSICLGSWLRSLHWPAQASRGLERDIGSGPVRFKEPERTNDEFGIRCQSTSVRGCEGS